jgi:hypothetical protein
VRKNIGKVPENSRDLGPWLFSTIMSFFENSQTRLLWHKGIEEEEDHLVIQHHDLVNVWASDAVTVKPIP